VSSRRQPWAIAVLLLALAAVVGLRAQAGSQALHPQSSNPPIQESASFESAVLPVLRSTCTRCHNERTMTAGLNLTGLTDPASLSTQREVWEKAMDRVRAGEMPPKEANILEPAEIQSFIAYVDREFEKADRDLKPDPGRVPIHRLNRVEYQNTIRDLLGVDFRASEEFPADDSGYGFDNIGDVLTVSPLLMQKYLSAAEAIAARAVGGDPLPSPGMFTRRANVRNIADNTIELKQIVAFDAEYMLRIGITGRRGNEPRFIEKKEPIPLETLSLAPVNVVVMVDGERVKTATVPVEISAVNKQGGGTQRTVLEHRIFLPSNEHAIRVMFEGDEDLKKIPPQYRRDAGFNIYPEYIEIAGPYAPAVKPMVPKKVLVCDPATGTACVNRILSSLVHRAYRRPVTAAEVARVTGVYSKAKAGGYPVLQSLQFAIASVLVSPEFLFRIERDPGPGRIAAVTDVELASRLSYFLWSSMPDDELMRLAEANKLSEPAVLRGQVARLLADPKSGALADNFAGQWLETRSLDAVAPDRTKFPEW
jgi:hypothetical protein